MSLRLAAMLFFLCGMLGGPLSAGAIDEGRRAALKYCTRCHVVGNFNRNGGISSTPSFQLLVNALKDYKERFDAFYMRPPHRAVIIVNWPLILTRRWSSWRIDWPKKSVIAISQWVELRRDPLGASITSESSGRFALH